MRICCVTLLRSVHLKLALRIPTVRAFDPSPRYRSRPNGPILIVQGILIILFRICTVPDIVPHAWWCKPEPITKKSRHGDNLGIRYFVGFVSKRACGLEVDSLNSKRQEGICSFPAWKFESHTHTHTHTYSESVRKKRA